MAINHDCAFLTAWDGTEYQVLKPGSNPPVWDEAGTHAAHNAHVATNPAPPRPLAPPHVFV